MADGDEWRPFAAMIFGSFANVLLPRALPRIREWLAARLGPRATIGSLTVDGSRIRLLDATVPLGPNVVLYIDRATLAAQTDDLASFARAPVRLVRMEARLAGGVQGAVSFEGSPSGQEWLDGVLRIDELAVGSHRALQCATRVRVSLERWQLNDGALVIDGATVLAFDVAGAAGSRTPDALRLDADELPVAVMLALGQAFGMPSFGLERLFADATIGGGIARVDRTSSIELELAGAVAGELHVREDETVRSVRARLEAPGLRLGGDARAEGDRWQGALALALDPSALRLPGVAIVADPAHVRLDLGGTERWPMPEGAFAIPRLDVRTAAGALSLHRLRAQLRLADAGVARVSARVATGRVEARWSRADGVAIAIERAPLAAVAHLIAWPDRLATFRDAHAWATLSHRDGTWRGRLHIESDRSRLSLDPCIASGASLGAGTVLSALIAAADLARIAPELHVVDGAPAGVALTWSEDGAADGTIECARLLAGVRPIEWSDVRARLAIVDRGVSLRDVSARSFGGAIAGSMRFGKDSLPIVELATVEPLASVGAWLAGQDLRAAADLAQLRVVGRLVPDERGHRLELGATSAASAFRIEGTIDGEGAVDANGVGVIAARELAALLPIPDTVVLDPDGAPWSIDASLRRRQGDNVVRVAGATPRAGIRLGGLALEELVDAKVDVEVDGGAMSIAVIARGYGGRARIDARHRDGRLVGQARIERAAIDAITERRVRGRLDATFAFVGAQGRTVAAARARVTEPSIALALPIGPRALTGNSLRASATIVNGGVRIHDAVADLDALRAEGSIDIVGDALDGDLDLRVRPAFLGDRLFAPLLTVALDRAIPLVITGSVREPRARLRLRERRAHVRLDRSVEALLSSLRDAHDPEQIARVLHALLERGIDVLNAL